MCFKNLYLTYTVTRYQQLLYHLAGDHSRAKQYQIFYIKQIQIYTNHKDEFSFTIFLVFSLCENIHKYFTQNILFRELCDNIQENWNRGYLPKFCWTNERSILFSFIYLHIGRRLCRPTFKLKICGFIFSKNADYGTTKY